MKNRSFTFNPNPCLVELDYHNASSSCLFDSWTLDHFYWQGFFYIIAHHFLKIKSMKHAIILLLVLTFLHGIEDYLGNIGTFNLEGVFIDTLAPIFDPKVDISLRGKDNDYMDNTIGDVLSGFGSCVLIILYWYKFNRLPYIYLIFSIGLLYLLYKKSYKLYPDNSG